MPIVLEHAIKHLKSVKISQVWKAAHVWTANQHVPTSSWVMLSLSWVLRQSPWPVPMHSMHSRQFEQLGAKEMRNFLSGSVVSYLGTTAVSQPCSSSKASTQWICFDLIFSVRTIWGMSFQGLEAAGIYTLTQPRNSRGHGGSLRSCFSAIAAYKSKAPEGSKTAANSHVAMSSDGHRSGLTGDPICQTQSENWAHDAIMAQP